MTYLHRITSIVLTLAFLVGAVGCVVWMDHASAARAHMPLPTAEQAGAHAEMAHIKKALPIVCTDCVAVQKIFSAAVVVAPVTSLLVSLGVTFFIATFFVCIRPALFVAVHSHAPPWLQREVYLIQRLRAHHTVVLLR